MDDEFQWKNVCLVKGENVKENMKKMKKKMLG